MISTNFLRYILKGLHKNHTLSTLIKLYEIPRIYYIRIFHTHSFWIPNVYIYIYMIMISGKWIYQALTTVSFLFPSFSLKLIPSLRSNLRWNVINLMVPSFDHLSRWSQANTITPTTISKTYIYFPPFSFLVYLLSLDPFPLFIFFILSPIVYLLLKCRKNSKNLSSEKVFHWIKNEISLINML